MRGKALAAATTAAVLVLSTASAYGADVGILEDVDSAGHPAVAAAIGGLTEELSVEWRRCADGGPVCEPLPATAYGAPAANGALVAPGETPAGTVFEAVYTKDGVESKLRSRVWQGRIAVAAAPTVQGEAAVGKTVTVGAATWVGGWAPDGRSEAIDRWIFACSTPTGGDCWLLSPAPWTVLESRWAGWYLFAQETRYPMSGLHICNSLGRLSGCSQIADRVAGPAHVGPTPSATVALSAPVGPITAPATKAPTASVRARALRRKGELLVGRVSCETRCTVALKVSGGGRKAVYKTLSVTGAKALTAPVRHGKLKVRVTVDGKLVTSGPTVAR